MRNDFRCLSSWIASAFILFGLASFAQAAEIYVEPATGSGVEPSDLATVTQLVKTSVSEVSSDTVTEQVAQSDLVLRPALVRIGQAYILSMSKVGKDGQVIFSSQLKAEKMDEMDKVAERLTRSVLTGEKAKDHARVGEITNEEAKEGTQRRPVRNSQYLGFGISNLINLNSSGVGYSFAYAYSWDVNVARIKILAELDGNGNALFVNAALGGAYFFTKGDVAPYVSADFGGGLAKLDGGSLFAGQSVGGFVLGAGAGVEFLRTSAVNLDLGFRSVFLLNSSNGYGIPIGLSVRLGIYF
jgi:hypothetical protein